MKSDSLFLPRKPFSWHDDPLPGTPHDAVLILDFHLMRLCQSPTFLAMMDTTPELENVPITINPSLPDTASYDSGAIEYGWEIRIAETNNLYPVFVLAHEYRHAWQDIRQLLSTLNLSTPSALLIERRAEEADAITFGYTVMHEIAQAEKRPLIKIGHPSNLILRNLWNKTLRNTAAADKTGAVQNEMFLTYMTTPDMLSTDYDKKLIALLVAAHAQRILISSTAEINATFLSDQTILKEKLRKYGAMPFLDKDGGLQDRPGYIHDLDLDSLLNDPAVTRLSPENQYLWNVEWDRLSKQLKLDSFKPCLG